MADLDRPPAAHEEWRRLTGAALAPYHLGRLTFYAGTMGRFWQGTDDERGSLIHRCEGSWAFSYGPDEDDDEPIFKFERHRFTVGEHVTITEHDGIARPFHMVGVEPAIRGT